MAVIDFRTRQEIKSGDALSDVSRVEAYVVSLEAVALRSLYAIRAASGTDWAIKTAENLLNKIRGGDNP